MRAWLERLMPRSIAGQMTVLLLGALFVAQVLTAVLFLRERQESFRSSFADGAALRVAGIVRLVEDAPRGLGQRILRGAGTGPGFRVRLSDAPPVPPPGARPARGQAEMLARALSRPAEDVRAVRIGRRGSPRTLVLAVRLQGPRPGWLIAEIRPPSPPPIGRAFLIVFAMNALAIGVVAALAARRLARPLRRLREAAERFGRGEPVEALALEGPDEVRRAAAAFNEMRDRLERLIRDRTIMLASLSHDLRTPITSLRLRAEFVEDEETRERIVETLGEMRAMTEEALAFASDDAVREPRRPLDLTALAESLADDLRARGAEAEVTSAARVVAPVRVNALRRALRNLTDNAIAYGTRVRIAVVETEAGIAVLVDDDGPGIPVEDRARVFTPFVRLETSRSRETGGTGLGLAIARSLVRAQGGDIALEEAPSGGLRVRVTLPV